MNIYQILPVRTKQPASPLYVSIMYISGVDLQPAISISILMKNKICPTFIYIWTLFYTSCSLYTASQTKQRMLTKVIAWLNSLYFLNDVNPYHIFTRLLMPLQQTAFNNIVEKGTIVWKGHSFFIFPRCIRL